jgi:DNA-binding response OmpR family regulator
VLVIEDEPTLVSAISYNLRQGGFDVISANDGVTGLQAARRERPDLIVLDLMLPKLDGLEVCRRVRAESGVPIIMLTAKAEETDRVVGLELGADDYVPKPFGMRELVARVRALLRRSATQEKPREFDLLALLAEHAGQVFTRDQILEHAWGYDFFGGSRTVDVHMRWLREKLEDDPAHPEHLLTVRGVGYKFVL